MGNEDYQVVTLLDPLEIMFQAFPKSQREVKLLLKSQKKRKRRGKIINRCFKTFFSLSE